MTWYGYILVTTLDLSSGQKNSIRNLIKGLGRQNTGSANGRNQYRESLDGLQAIAESEFSDDDLSVESMRSALAPIIPGSPNSVEHSVSQDGGDDVHTYSRVGTDYITIRVYAGYGSSWKDSRQAASDYLILNSTNWETDEQ